MTWGAEFSPSMLKRIAWWLVSEEMAPNSLNPSFVGVPFIHLAGIESSLKLWNQECIKEKKQRVKQFLVFRFSCNFLLCICVTHTRGCLHSGPWYKRWLCSLPHFLLPIFSSATPDMQPCHQLTAMAISWSTCSSQWRFFLPIRPVCSRLCGYHLFVLETFSFCFLDTNALFFSYFVSFSFLFSCAASFLLTRRPPGHCFSSASVLFLWLISSSLMALSLTHRMMFFKVVFVFSDLDPSSEIRRLSSVCYPSSQT